MKIETFLIVDETNVVGSFCSLDEASDFIRGVVIRHCVGRLSAPSSFTESDDVVNELKNDIPHYCIRRVTVDTYETSDYSCD